MESEDLAIFIGSFPGSIEEQPFGPETDVFKVGGRIFAILSPEGERPSISLKCDPDLALALREEYPSVTPGYHLNKRHWNTVVIDAEVPDDELCDMVRHSYEQVVAKLTAVARSQLQGILDAPH